MIVDRMKTPQIYLQTLTGIEHPHWSPTRNTADDKMILMILDNNTYRTTEGYVIDQGQKYLPRDLIRPKMMSHFRRRMEETHPGGRIPPRIKMFYELLQRHSDLWVYLSE